MEKPELTSDEVTKLVRNLYGLIVTEQQKLNSTDDVNIRVLVADQSNNPTLPSVSRDGYVLKVLNSIDSQKVQFVGAMHEAIDCSVRNGILTPRPIHDIKGQLWSLQTLKTQTQGEGQFLVRLFEYLPGEMLIGKPCTPYTCYQIGKTVAKVSSVLKDFSHPALDGHKRHWSLTEVANLKDKIDCISDESDRKLILDVVENFKQNVVANYCNMLKGSVHADLNSENIIVRPKTKSPATQTELPTDYDVYGILDFGDLVHEYCVFEPAIALMYVMGENTTVDPIEAGGHFLAGYLPGFQLPKLDLDLLKDCICGRFAQSLVYGAYSHKLDPSNTYVLHTAKKGWTLLRTLWGTSTRDLYSIWNCVLEKYNLKLNLNVSE